MGEPAIERSHVGLRSAHAGDPNVIEGIAAEELYAERLMSWVTRLAPNASSTLMLAANAQHLERWSIPRSDYPLGNAGYHSWRRAVQNRQGQRAREILLSAGCSQELAHRVAELAAKNSPLNDPDAQVLEDAACLVFIGDELEKFAKSHSHYSTTKFVSILQMTLQKMSPKAQSFISTLTLTNDLKALIRTAAPEP